MMDFFDDDLAKTNFLKAKVIIRSLNGQPKAKIMIYCSLLAQAMYWIKLLDALD